MAASDAAIESLSGVAGAIVSLFATYPLLTVSTIQALKHKTSELQRNESGSVHASKSVKALQELEQLVRRGGWSSLYTGIEPAVLGTAVSQGVYFYLYSLLRHGFVVSSSGAQPSTAQGDSKQQNISVGASLAVAALAGCGNVLLTSPVWVVVTQMQAAHKHKNLRTDSISSWSIARSLYQDKGLAGFWQGVTPSLVMVANPTIQYMVYEQIIGRILQSRRQAAAQGATAAVSVKAAEVFLASAVAKLVATVATYPLLLVKNRLQAMSAHTEHDMKYRHMLDAVQRIYKGEGLAGFFKGMNIKIVQTVLAAALLMMIKEQVYKGTRYLLKGPQPAKKLARTVVRR